MASFYIPLTGLNSDSTALNTIANNLANMNTIGYKSQSVNFSDLFHQQLGSTGAGDPIQLGSGTQVASIVTNFSTGSPNTTGVATDVALQGNGFFVVSDGNAQFLTRAGNFKTDSSGNLITTSGMSVMGHPAANGVVDTKAPLTAITIPQGQVEPPKATSTFGMTAILDSSAPVGASVPGTVQVYDSLGKQYNATVTYTKTGTNAWSYSVTLPDTLEAAPIDAPAATTIPVSANPALATSAMAAATPAAPAPATVPSSVGADVPVSKSTTAALLPSTTIPVTTQNSTLAANTAVPGTVAYTFAPTGVVNGSTSLTITDGTNTVTVAPSAPPESVSAFAAEITAALLTATPRAITATVTGTDGVPLTNTNGSLTIVGANIAVVAGSLLKQDMAETTNNFNLVSSNGVQATVDSSTNLGIKMGNALTKTAPAFTGSQTLTAYAASLQTAIGAPAVSGVTITANAATGQLSITGPANMTITGSLIQDFAGTQTSYTLGSYTDPTTQVTTQATIDPATNLTITGPTVDGSTATATVDMTQLAPPTAANYAATLKANLATVGITGVTVTENAGQISIVGPSTMRLAGNIQQDMQGTTNDFGFHKDGTVDPTTNLTITGETAAGRKVTITPPSFAAGETVAQYAADLNTAIAAEGILNVTASVVNGNDLRIVGANLTLSGSVSQDLATSTINYNFGASGKVNPATNLTITGPATVGGTATITPPAILPGESVAQYAADLTVALTTAGIKTGFGGVTITANGSQLSIVGPATTVSTAGTASEDITATTINYSFAASGGKVATVDPATNLTITGPAIGGGTATTIAPKVVPGETLAQYAKAMNDAINAAGIAGAAVTSNAAGLLSIVGSGISTSGSVIQEPVASANAQGSLLFDATGNLVGPTADISGITFAGLSDGSATLDMTWGILGQGGKPIISQVNQTSEFSSRTQDGFTSGGYNGFSIGSDGTVTASFLNGKTLDVGQLVLGSVANLQGLKAMGSGNFAATTASGTVTVGASGTSGLGTMEGGALEASNVNISAEFSNLIIAQRAFEANSKAVTTFDTVTQTTINMIR